MTTLRKVLVIDDDPLQLEMMRDYLERRTVPGIKCVSDSQIAVNILLAPPPDQPDLVISDIYMPGIDGIEILSILSDIRPAVPVILVSGAGNVQLEAASALATGYGLDILGAFSKPLDYDSIDLALSDFECVSECHAPNTKTGFAKT